MLLAIPLLLLSAVFVGAVLDGVLWTVCEVGKRYGRGLGVAWTALGGLYDSYAGVRARVSLPPSAPPAVALASQEEVIDLRAYAIPVVADVAPSLIPSNTPQTAQERQEAPADVQTSATVSIPPGAPQEQERATVPYGTLEEGAEYKLPGDWIPNVKLLRKGTETPEQAAMLVIPTSQPTPTPTPPTADVYVQRSKGKYRPATDAECRSLPDAQLYARLSAPPVKVGGRRYVPLSELAPDADVA